MKCSHQCNKVIVAAVGLASLGFAVFTLISASSLHYSTLQAIDGPITAVQIEALRLSSALSATSVGIVVGVVFATISGIMFRRSTILTTDEIGRSTTA